LCSLLLVFFIFFFFQAEDGIRDFHVTGVQTCALPIFSYTVSVIFVILGVGIGLFIPSLNTVIQWIVSALFGAYTASNVLKWYWWRFNGFGYFWGMVTGFAIALPLIFTDIQPINAFPFMFVACFVVCVGASLATKPDDMEVLKKFYLKVRPWGFWGPVLAELRKEYPELKANT